MNIEDSTLLRLAFLNLNKITETINLYNEKNKIKIDNNYNKSFFMDLNDYFDSYKINDRYDALIQLFLSFIDINNENISNFNNGYCYDNCNKFIKENNVKNAYQYGVFESLIQNLNYFFSTFISSNEKPMTIKKIELIFFIKINTFLIYLILFILKANINFQNDIKNNCDKLEEIILNFLKNYNNKFVPVRLLLCAYYIFFSLLIDGNFENNVNPSSMPKYLTKQNYTSYLSPPVPLIFLSAKSTNSPYYFIERFYRRNLIVQQKNDIEMVFISQILKILLSSFSTSKSAENNEMVKDFIVELILENIYKEQGNQEYNDQKEINIQEAKQQLTDKSEDNKILIGVLTIFNREGIIHIISNIYLKALKCFKHKNLIQYTYLSFLFKDSNGLKVFLALLKQEYKAQSEQFLSKYSNENSVNQFRELNKSTLLSVLKVIYNIVNKIDDFIIVLIDCHVPIMLNNILNSSQLDEKIKKACLKLFKLQMKFLNKNWRQENENIITDIYLMLKVSCKERDEYLKYKDPKDKDFFKETNPVFFREDELKLLFGEFHEKNYFKYLNNLSLYEKYFDEKKHSTYMNVMLKLYEKLDNEKKE